MSPTLALPGAGDGNSAVGGSRSVSPMAERVRSTPTSLSVGEDLVCVGDDDEDWRREDDLMI